VCRPQDGVGAVEGRQSLLKAAARERRAISSDDDHAVVALGTQLAESPRQPSAQIPTALEAQLDTARQAQLPGGAPGCG
jgi:hypothetical protein